MADEQAAPAAQPPTEETKKNDDNNNNNKASQPNSESEKNDKSQASDEKDAPGGRVTGKIADARQKLTSKEQKLHDKQNPPGGYDQTPIPPADDGYTVRITFHRAVNLPVSDLQSRASDPFLTATLTSALAKRHKEDPDLVLRTPTVHKDTNPSWETQWVVAGVPGSGFRLKCRLYDEDFADHDDRLGNVTVVVGKLDEQWAGIREEEFSIKKRMASKRAYLLRGCVAMLSRDIQMSGKLVLSVEVLGKSDKPYGRIYTVGQTFWYKHYSPMIGRLTGMKAPESDEKEKDKKEKQEGDQEPNKQGKQEKGDEDKPQKYDFQANQIQLQGPVPPELYHRFVEFKPFVKGMFAKAGIRGRILNRALHHQHARVYNFSSTTEHGIVEPKSEEASLQFLKMVHFDEGGRIFTYVLTLDGLLRFTETGKEFGIDLLSKHTMHSDVNIYIACSGEFFVRRLKDPNKSAESPTQETHPDADLPGGPPDAAPPQNPKDYELVIDNDSGTYRPDGSVLPKLKEFLNANFPGLHVVIKECTDKDLDKMKEQQRERKKKEGKQVEMVQNSDDEISSSDEEALTNHGSGRKKTKKQRAYDALEDPKVALQGVIPGMGKEKGGNGETRESS